MSWILLLRENTAEDVFIKYYSAYTDHNFFLHTTLNDDSVPCIANNKATVSQETGQSNYSIVIFRQ